MAKKKKKGFSLSELLAVVVILGILSIIAIAAYSKYIDNAKKVKDKSNEEIIVNATKSYLANNKDHRPRAIGEATKIKVSTLRESNYLKEDILNSKGESCMKDSYIYVYKNSYQEFTYRGVLYCGDDEIKPEEEIPKPVLRKFEFANSENISNASFSMIILGNEEEDVGIESYNYSISLLGGNENDKTETYNTGSYPGKGQTRIELNDIRVRDFIDPTGYTKIKVSVIIRNKLGGIYEHTEIARFEDTTAPKCGEITNQAKDDEDWINKSNIDNMKRMITVKCDDRLGSGCLRQEFTKTWPRNKKESLEYSTIEIVDNSKKANKSNCRVRVNIDIEAPTININTKNKKEETTISKTAKDGETVKILNTEYKDVYNGWLNGNNYKDKITYNVNVKDNIWIDRYTWETNGSEYVEETFEQEESSHLKEVGFNVYFVDEGLRQGKLTVYDKAGNSTTIIVNANVDLTAPNKPITNLYKWSNNSAKPTSSSGLEEYIPDEWSSKKIYTYASDSVDNVSGFKEYQYTTTGEITETDKSGTTKHIEKEGITYIKYRACDNAGNCSDYNDKKTVKIDMNAPTLTITLLNNNSSTPFVRVINPGTSITFNKGDYPNLNNGWFNGVNYPQGAQFRVTSTDNYSLYKYTWNTTDSDSSSDEYNGVTSKSFDIGLTIDGLRQGKLSVYDRAGNKTEVTINADIDRVAPNKPTTNLYKWSDNSTRPANANGLDSYTPNEWSSRRIYTKASGSTDDLSKLKEYQYTASGATTNATNQAGTSRNVEAKGISYIKYRACDKAGNCSGYNTQDTIKIDLDGPTVSCGVDSSSRKINNVSVTDSQSQEKARYYSITTKKGTYNWKSSNNAGGNDCGTTYYAYVKAVDNVNNETIKYCGSYSKTCCSSDNPYGCEWVTSCRDQWTTLYYTVTPYSWAGVARHNYDGYNDKLYLLKDSSGNYITTEASGVTWIKVYASSAEYCGGKEVWIAKNCVGLYYNQVNTSCTHDAPSTCPG